MDPYAAFYYQDTKYALPEYTSVCGQLTLGSVQLISETGSGDSFCSCIATVWRIVQLGVFLNIHFT